jgi:uncharacterized protein (DUF1810 family)
MSKMANYDLKRFVDAQKDIYETVLMELRNGKKRTCWMWFIFPQIEGLGKSPNAVYYSIESIEESQGYLNHPVLGPRLIECCEAILGIQGRSAIDIFGFPDDLKLLSCMTLFEQAASSPLSIFNSVLDKYFPRERDYKTIEIWGGFLDERFKDE